MEKIRIIHSLHVLGLKPGADARQVRSAFRRLVRANHPDIAGARGAKKFEQITEAYALLKNLSDQELVSGGTSTRYQETPAPRESFFAKWKRKRAEKKEAEAETVRSREQTKFSRIDQIINSAERKISSSVAQTEKNKKSRHQNAIRFRLASSNEEVRKIAARKSKSVL